MKKYIGMWEFARLQFLSIVILLGAILPLIDELWPVLFYGSYRLIISLCFIMLYAAIFLLAFERDGSWIHITATIKHSYERRISLINFARRNALFPIIGIWFYFFLPKTFEDAEAYNKNKEFERVASQFRAECLGLCEKEIQASSYAIPRFMKMCELAPNDLNLVVEQIEDVARFWSFRAFEAGCEAGSHCRVTWGESEYSELCPGEHSAVHNTPIFGIWHTPIPAEEIKEMAAKFEKCCVFANIFNDALQRIKEGELKKESIASAFISAVSAYYWRR